MTLEKKLLKYVKSHFNFYWPELLKLFKLGNEFKKPEIFLDKKYNVSYFLDDKIAINFKLALDAYGGKKFKKYKFLFPYEICLKDDIIHETVHYLHSHYYPVDKKEYDPYPESLALLATYEIMLRHKDSRLYAICLIADCLKKSNKTIKLIDGVFRLKKSEKEFLKKILQKKYNPKGISKEHVEGFILGCKLKKKLKNYHDYIIFFY